MRILIKHTNGLSVIEGNIHIDLTKEDYYIYSYGRCITYKYFITKSERECIEKLISAIVSNTETEITSDDFYIKVTNNKHGEL